LSSMIFIASSASDDSCFDLRGDGLSNGRGWLVVILGGIQSDHGQVTGARIVFRQPVD
jgi:hypothetical protein